MNKRDARSLSMNESLTIGELKAMVTARLLKGGMSKVNPSLTIEQVCEIYAGALAGRDDAEIPKGEVYSPIRDRYVASRDSLIIRNILRDCASRRR